MCFTMTKIDIISGFLGAGKTTLIKKLIAEALDGEKLVLIENEFGEIGIDGGFLKESGIEITEMNSGCICCSLVGDFETSLKEVLQRFSPDRIIIEPSGVGKLSDVIRAVAEVTKNNREVTLNSFVTVADALKCKMYMKNFGEFYNNQIEHAAAILLSRTQNLTDEKLENCVKEIRSHNPDAAILTTPWEQLKGKQILSAMEKKHSLAEQILGEEDICPKCGQHHDHHHGEAEHGRHHHEDGHDGHSCCGHDHNHDHHHHADDVFQSWGQETPHKYSREAVKTALEALASSQEYGVILRAKGIVPLENGDWIQFDMVPEEYEIRNGEPDYTGKLCVIGTNLNEEKIKELFHLS